MKVIKSVIFFTTILLFIYSISNAGDLNCQKKVILNEELANVLKMKTRGENPDYERITYKIANAEERKAKIQSLTNNFSSIQTNTCFETDYFPIVYVSDAMKDIINIDVLTRHAGMGLGGPSGPFLMNIDSIFDINIDNANEFNKLKASDLAKNSQFFTDMSKNSRQVQGFSKIKFAGVRLESNQITLPTIEKTKIDKYGVVSTTAISIDLYDYNKNKVYSKTIVPDLNSLNNQNIENKEYSQKLATSNNSGEFDIKGLNTSMSLEKIKSIGKQNGWYLEDNVNPKGSIRFCSHDCEMPTVQLPAGSFSIIIRYEPRDGKTEISEIDFRGYYTLKPTEMKNLILEKYGIPLVRDSKESSEYYWGADISKWTQRKEHHIFRLSFTQYDSPTDKGELFNLFITAYNPHIPSQESVPPVKQSL